MGSPPSEVLVELQPGAGLDDAVPAGARVLQHMPPRFAIVVAGDEELRALQRSPHVTAVFTDDVPPDALERLDPVSRAFAAGWNERQRLKERPGEGLPWDAPGFQAP
jgi:hypothetical protein